MRDPGLGKMGNLCMNSKPVDEKKPTETRESDKTPAQKRYPYNWPAGAEQVGYLTERQVKARLKTQTEQVRFFVLPSVCPSVRVSPSLRCVVLDPRPRPRAFAANVVGETCGVPVFVLSFLPWDPG